MIKLKYLLAFLLCFPVMLLAGQDSQFGEVSAENVLIQDLEFNHRYDAYTPTSEDLQLIQQIKGKRLVVLFGRWCHDSQREVPKLLKLLNKSEVELQQLTLIAVDRQKTTPQQIEQPFNLKYTPTIILFDGQHELGRIIEAPNRSLTQDLVDFIKQ